MGCGASSSNIVINFDKTHPLFFGGETVSGTVQLYVNDDKLEADKIDMALVGEIGYTTQRTDGRHHTTTEYHNVQFFALKHIFTHTQAGENQLTYSQGCYSFPFQFQLPAQLPPTMNQAEKYPHLRYSLIVLIVKPGGKGNVRQNRYMTVFPQVSLQNQPNCLMKTMFGNHNRKDIIVKGFLNKLGYVPGETIQGTMEIENPQHVLIKQIDLSIHGTYDILSHSAGFKVTSCTVPGIVNRNEEQIAQPFEVVIPSSTLPPSYQFKGGHTLIVTANSSYMLKFEVKVEGMFTDFEIMVPIILGTKP